MEITGGLSVRDVTGVRVRMIQQLPCGSDQRMDLTWSSDESRCINSSSSTRIPNGLGGNGPQRPSHSTPCVGRDTCHQTRLLRGPAEFWMEENFLTQEPRKRCYISYRSEISPADGFLHFSPVLLVGFAVSVKTHGFFSLLATGVFFCPPLLCSPKSSSNCRWVIIGVFLWFPVLPRWEGVKVLLWEDTLSDCWWHLHHV